jgi:hypothetical protein
MFPAAVINHRLSNAWILPNIPISNNTILDFCRNMNYDLNACTVDIQEMKYQGRQVWGS